MASKVMNKQHHLDMLPEREDSLLSDEFVLASFCGSDVSSSHCRGLMQREANLTWRFGRCRFLLPLVAAAVMLRRRTTTLEAHGEERSASAALEAKP